MATRRRNGLDEVQLATLRSQVADGKTPRVAVSGTHFPPGTMGQIVRIGDPGSDGNDFITVRVKVDRVVDELQFAPAELTSTVPGQKVEPKPRPSAAAPAAGASKAAARRQSPPPAKAAVKVRPSAAARPTAPANDSARATPAKRRSAPAKPVTITITSSGADWNLNVQRGSRAVIRSLAITPGVVSAFAKLVANAELTEAVSEINDAARYEAEERAARLRAELSAVEAVLATHKTPR